MEFGAVYRLIDHSVSGEFVVMVIHRTKDTGSPMSVLILNTYPHTPDDYTPGMVANWSVYSTDWERLYDDQ